LTGDEEEKIMEALGHLLNLETRLKDLWDDKEVVQVVGMTDIQHCTLHIHFIRSALENVLDP